MIGVPIEPRPDGVHASPEEVAKEFCAALDSQDWGVVTSLSDGASLERVAAERLVHARDLVDPGGFAQRSWRRWREQLDPSSQAEVMRYAPSLAREFGGVESLAVLEAMRASELVELSLAASFGRFLPIITPIRRWLGVILEDDLAHVLYRFSVAESTAPAGDLEIMTLTRSQEGWRVAWTGRAQMGLPGLGSVHITPDDSSERQSGA